jgi:hypothetical protein
LKDTSFYLSLSLNISNVYLSLSCSYVIPQDNGRIVDQSKGTQQTVWDSNCGHSFGHELTFSRTLEMQMNQTTNFETVKNSHGGSEIYRDWYPNHGRYWNELQSSIRSRKGSGNWKGFLWHQGTQGMRRLYDVLYVYSVLDLTILLPLLYHFHATEAWTEEDTSLTYLGNLTGLIKEVRKEMLVGSAQRRSQSLWFRLEWFRLDTGKCV